MKNIYTLILVFFISSNFASAQIVWDNFENTRKGNYGFINGTFIPYNENPDKSGINTSLVAARYTRNAAELFDVIILDGVMANVSDYINGTKQIKIDVWSPAVGKTVQITLENSTLALPANYPTGRHSEHIATTTVANAWQTLTFNFNGQPDASVANTNVNRMVILFDPNSNNNDTYYFDNIQGPELAVDPCASTAVQPSILNDFECQQNVNFIFSHSGINFQRVANPQTMGNPSSHVARYVRNGGESNDVIIGRFNGNLNLQPNNVIKLDVWDPTAPTNVIVSLQNNTGDVILEMNASTQAGNSWSTLIYDPSSVADAQDITQFVILFDPGSNTADQYFFDNFMLDISGNVNESAFESSLNAFPNPTAGETTFTYALKNKGHVRFSIQDMTGKTCYSEDLGVHSAGNYQTIWDARGFSNGMYFYTFTVDGRSSNGRLILNK